MLDDLAVTRGDEGSGGADDPGSGLHGSSRQSRAASSQGDPRVGADEHGDDVHEAEHAMAFQVTLAKP
jgi:hypothetical protein